MPPPDEFPKEPGLLQEKPFLGKLSHNARKQALFDGFISSEEVQKRMERASIIIIPSLWEEPFGLVVAEAMSNGVGIITSNVGGIPEVIRDNGIIINKINEPKIKNALLNLLNDPKKLQALQKLSWKNFKHTSELSSKKLDKHRKKLVLDEFKRL